METFGVVDVQPERLLVLMDILDVATIDYWIQKLANVAVVHLRSK